MKRKEELSGKNTEQKGNMHAFRSAISEYEYKDNNENSLGDKKPAFGRLDKESEADKKWEIDYAKRQRIIKKKRKHIINIALLIVSAAAIILFTVSALKEKNKRDILEADKEDYLQLLYVQCAQAVNALDSIELVSNGMGQYELFVDSLKAIGNLDNEYNNMEQLISGFSSFDMTIEQISQNLYYGQKSYQYEAFDADNTLSEAENNYLTNLRYDFQKLSEAIYPEGHFKNLKAEEINHLFTDIINKYKTNSDIRTFSDKYSSK